MTRVLIIEDEKMAAARLKSLLKEYADDIEIAAEIDSVKNAVQWFLNKPQPDLLFLDIHLGDGLSFEIFDFVKIDCPVIFTTAFDEYAIRAFQVNSIDYLLKPLNKEELFKAMDKFRNLFGNKSENNAGKLDLSLLKSIVNGYEPSYKNRIIVKTGEHIKALSIQNILYFFSYEKGTYAQTNENRKYLIDYTMDQTEEMLDPGIFFRINRQYIISFEAIKDMISYTNSRIKVVLQNAADEKDIIVSREKVGDFKKWLDR